MILVNLFALLVGFALLSRHFEQSRVPQLLPRLLPDDWKGGRGAARAGVRVVRVPRQHRGGA